MSVLVEAISVVIRNDVLERRYPGGLAAYRSRCPNHTFCTDGTLARVGFMSREEVAHFVRGLARKGFVFFRDEAFVDFAVVDQTVGPTGPCPWLTFARHEDGYCLCWLAGSPPGELAHPADWTPADSQSLTLRPEENLEADLEYLGTEANSDVFRDRATGQIQYVGGTSPVRLGRWDDLGNRLVALGAELERAVLAGASKSAGAIAIRREVERLLGEAQELRSHSGRGASEAPALHVCGVALNILGRWSEAEPLFLRVVMLRPDVPGPWLDLTCCLGAQGKVGPAEEAARCSVARAPESELAWGNLGGALFQAGRLAEAREAVTKALTLDPANAKNLRLAARIDEAARAHRV